MNNPTMTLRTRAAGRCGHLAIVAAVLIGTTACAGGSTTEDTPEDATATTTTAEAAGELDAGTAGRLDAAIEQAIAAANAPGAIVGVWSPQGDYIRSFGVADKATDAPMETDFYSRIGSVTKTFTVTAVLQLADEGKLGLDDVIAEYVDGVPEGDKITLRQLARMESGLPNYTAVTAFGEALFSDPLRTFTPQELLDYAFSEPSPFAPGEQFEYCNTNTVLLGLVVEKIGGLPLHEFIRERITGPLGMSDTSFPTDNAFPQPHAQGYTNQTLDESETIATEWNPSWGWAAGAMISTLDDMRIWAPALAAGELLTAEMQEQRLQTVSAPGMPPQDGYGLGLFDLGGWIGHNGSLPGYQTVAVHLPERDTTLVILINTDTAVDEVAPSTILATAITRELTPDHVYSLGPAQEPAPATPPR